MSTSLSILADNLFERIHTDKCTDGKPCIDYISVKGGKLILSVQNVIRITIKILIKI